MVPFFFLLLASCVKDSQGHGISLWNTRNRSVRIWRQSAFTLNGKLWVPNGNRPVDVCEEILILALTSSKKNMRSQDFDPSPTGSQRWQLCEAAALHHWVDLPYVCVSVIPWCLVLCEPMACSPPGSSVHGILPDKNTGVRCHFLLQGIFPTQGWNLGLLCCRQTLRSESPGKPSAFVNFLLKLPASHVSRTCPSHGSLLFDSWLVFRNRDTTPF